MEYIDASGDQIRGNLRDILPVFGGSYQFYFQITSWSTPAAGTSSWRFRDGRNAFVGTAIWTDYSTTEVFVSEGTMSEFYDRFVCGNLLWEQRRVNWVPADPAFLNENFGQISPLEGNVFYQMLCDGLMEPSTDKSVTRTGKGTRNPVETTATGSVLDYRLRVRFNYPNFANLPGKIYMSFVISSIVDNRTNKTSLIFCNVYDNKGSTQDILASEGEFLIYNGVGLDVLKGADIYMQFSAGTTMFPLVSPQQFRSMLITSLLTESRATQLPTQSVSSIDNRVTVQYTWAVRYQRDYYVPFNAVNNDEPNLQISLRTLSSTSTSGRPQRANIFIKTSELYFVVALDFPVSQPQSRILRWDGDAASPNAIRISPQTASALISSGCTLIVQPFAWDSYAQPFFEAETLFDTTIFVGVIQQALGSIGQPRIATLSVARSAFTKEAIGVRNTIEVTALYSPPGPPVPPEPLEMDNFTRFEEQQRAVDDAKSLIKGRNLDILPQAELETYLANFVNAYQDGLPLENMYVEGVKRAFPGQAKSDAERQKIQKAANDFVDTINARTYPELSDFYFDTKQRFAAANRHVDQLTLSFPQGVLKKYKGDFSNNHIKDPKKEPQFANAKDKLLSPEQEPEGKLKDGRTITFPESLVDDDAFIDGEAINEAISSFAPYAIVEMVGPYVGFAAHASMWVANLRAREYGFYNFAHMVQDPNGRDILAKLAKGDSVPVTHTAAGGEAPKLITWLYRKATKKGKSKKSDGLISTVVSWIPGMGDPVPEPDPGFDDDPIPEYIDPENDIEKLKGEVMGIRSKQRHFKKKTVTPKNETMPIDNQSGVSGNGTLSIDQGNIMSDASEVMAQEGLLTVVDIENAPTAPFAIVYLREADRIARKRHIPNQKYLFDPDLTTTTQGRLMTTIAISDLVRHIFFEYDLDPIGYQLVRKTLASYFKESADYCAEMQNPHGAAQFSILKSVVLPQNHREHMMKEYVHSFLGPRRLFDSKLSIQETSLNKFEDLNTLLDHPGELHDFVEKVTSHLDGPYTKQSAFGMYIQNRPRREYILPKQTVQAPSFPRLTGIKRPREITYRTSNMPKSFGFNLPQREDSELSVNQLYKLKQLKIR